MYSQDIKFSVETEAPKVNVAYDESTDSSYFSVEVNTNLLLNDTKINMHFESLLDIVKKAGKMDEFKDSMLECVKEVKEAISKTEGVCLPKTPTVFKRDVFIGYNTRFRYDSYFFFIIETSGGLENLEKHMCQFLDEQSKKYEGE